MCRNIFHIIKIILIIFPLYFLTNIYAQESVLTSNYLQKDSLLNSNLQQSKKHLYQLLLQNLPLLEINQQNNLNTFTLGKALNVYLNKNGLMFSCINNQSVEIYFSEIIDYKFKIYSIENNIQSSNFSNEYKLKIGQTILSVKNNNLQILKTLTNQFIQVQQLFNTAYFKMNEFDFAAQAHLNKPTEITEEIRKYIVQADAFTKLLNYQKAIELNYKIIGINSTASADSYFNLAILLAETNRLHSAVYNMKKFLILNTNEIDAQYAKTKINDWQIILNN